MARVRGPGGVIVGLLPKTKGAHFGMVHAMNDLSAFSLFRFYHLGFDADYEYGFRNLHHAATHFGVSADDIKARLAEWQLDAAHVKRVDYNLARAHSDAQMLDLDGASLGDREAFATRIWEEFQAARSAGLSDTLIDHLDVQSAFDLDGAGKTQSES